MAKEESGIDELMRLSRQFAKQQEDRAKQEHQRAEQGKKVKGVLQGLQNLNLNMALDQLKTVAKPEIIRQVSTLKGGQSTETLRKIITRLVDDLEKQLSRASGTKAEIAPMVNATRTLSILLDLYFSLN
ncbi:MAG: hypothetical protein WC370_07155 [Dehalococcoidales bacterium]|jgi:hypothetical protein